MLYERFVYWLIVIIPINPYNITAGSISFSLFLLHIITGVNPLTAGRKKLCQNLPSWTKGLHMPPPAQLRCGGSGSATTASRSGSNLPRLVVVAAGFETAWTLVVVDLLFKDYNTQQKNTQRHTTQIHFKKSKNKGCVFFWCIGLFSCLKGRFGTWNKSSQTWRRVLTNIMSAPYLLPPLSVWHFTRGTFFLQIKEWTKKAEWSYLELLNQLPSSKRPHFQ